MKNFIVGLMSGIIITLSGIFILQIPKTDSAQDFFEKITQIFTIQNNDEVLCMKHFRCLEGIVVNPDVPLGKSRCGLEEAQDDCILYIMNSKKHEVKGKDFYVDAAKQTNRDAFLISTGNIHYSSVNIKPGYIAQIYIPSDQLNQQ